MRNRLLSVAFVGVLWGCGPSGGLQADAGDNTPTPDAAPQPTCTEGQTQCSGTTAHQTCQNGNWVTTATCTADQVCSSNLGCVDCVPDSNYCVGNSVHMCTSSGTDGGEVEACVEPLQCSDGSCKDLCEEAETNRSYIGCEYWAVDLDNATEVLSGFNTGSCAQGVAANLMVCANGSSHQGLCEPNGTCPGSGMTCQARDVCVFNAQLSPFAVVVSNPQSFPIDITIENQGGTTHTETVAAGAVAKLFPQMLGFTDQSTDHTSQTASAYKVSAPAPFVAYQFNPLNNEDVFSNDGSLLIPRTTFDEEYYAMTWKTINRRNPQLQPAGSGLHDWHSYVSIVAWQDDTQITVTPSGNVKAGPTLAAITSGTPTNFTLNAFEVLTIQGNNTAAAPEQDLTGTRVVATNGKSFGVFAGNEAISIISDGAQCCADHIEEMMFPTSTWGTAFAMARSKKRRNENDFVRIIAKDAGTTVTITPAPANGSCGTLGAGQFCQIEISGDTEIVSNDKPIMIGHYLASSIVPSPLPPIIPSEGNGDPSMSLAVPTEQFRSSYTFLVPDEYDENHVSVVAAANATVTLDGNDVSGQLASFASGSHKAGRIAVNAGQHTVTCPGGCSIEVYGYSDAVSYLFAGGLDLEQIVID